MKFGSGKANLISGCVLAINPPAIPQKKDISKRVARKVASKRDLREMGEKGPFAHLQVVATPAVTAQTPEIQCSKSTQ